MVLQLMRSVEARIADEHFLGEVSLFPMQMMRDVKNHAVGIVAVDDRKRGRDQFLVHCLRRKRRRRLIERMK